MKNESKIRFFTPDNREKGNRRLQYQERERKHDSKFPKHALIRELVNHKTAVNVINQYM